LFKTLYKDFHRNQYFSRNFRISNNHINRNWILLVCLELINQLFYLFLIYIMSVQNAMSNEPFDLNFLPLRKPLVFPDGTIQDTAYTGDGSETLAEVLTAGSDAGNQSITGLSSITVNSAINLTPTGDTVNFNGEINQIALGQAQNGNQLRPTVVYSNTAGASLNYGLAVVDDAVNGLRVYPNAVAGTGNPTTVAGDVVIGSVGQNLNVEVNNATSNGIRITPTTVVLGVGGAGAVPTCNIGLSSAGVFTSAYTSLEWVTTALPAAAGAATGLYFPITINGTPYKIALLGN
jgi:hypothetical protein